MCISKAKKDTKKINKCNSDYNYDELKCYIRGMVLAEELPSQEEVVSLASSFNIQFGNTQSYNSPFNSPSYNSGFPMNRAQCINEAFMDKNKCLSKAGASLIKRNKCNSEYNEDVSDCNFGFYVALQHVPTEETLSEEDYNYWLEVYGDEYMDCKIDAVNKKDYQKYVAC